MSSAAAPASARPSAVPTRTAALPLPPELGSNGLPVVLSKHDERLYRDIFRLQEKGQWAAADERIGKLRDKRLLGHLLAQRYLHPTAYRSRYVELRDWLAAYADHPDAPRIYKLALKRKPKNYRMPTAPTSPRPMASLEAPEWAKPYRSSKHLSAKERRAAARLKRQIRRHVLRTRLSVTEDLLASSQTRRLLDQVEIDEGYADVAAAWFYYGNDARALELADAAATRSGDQVPIAHWTAGLAAWRLGRPELAARHFSALALAPRASGWNRAAGAYWTARAHLRLRNPAEVSRWLVVSAKYPRTFYGLLAQRALGLRPHLAFDDHEIDAALVARIEAEAAGGRALALLQVDERSRAEDELTRLNAAANPQTARALLALAERAQMAELAFRLGNRLAALDSDVAEGSLDLALYPIPPWRPESGFVVDRALVYALMRQESGFNPRAKSPSGAHGLLQLLPSTASFIARDRGFRHRKRHELFDPATNLELGQRYIAHLLEHALVQGDLFRLATAYNGGPGNLNKWQRRMEYQNDPLLFIESLPSRETRLFVERVLTNFWIYRMRLGQRAPSLDGIAAGEWPLYVPQDGETPTLASHESD